MTLRIEKEFSNKAREILEDENVFRLLKHIVVKSDDLQEELIYIIAGYLVSIDKLDRIKDRNKRIKEKINIKNSLTNFYMMSMMC